ncbi:ABC transporter permease [Saccharothrix syringae]|uniref:ABC transporter permease n=1 Tax=Saccharothrix syringae TaxID=103733 RepID=A0A5Q0HD23_SACSY|nr:ABC transporter permease [Saccharothrix syringae]QFZ23855.1 ABC transporter permease [Saccharothrix syringae]
MTLLAVERIKLFSTRSPWWCMLLALVLTTGITAIIAINWDGTPMPLVATVLSHTFGLYVVMVMAALAVTTEYRFGTIKSTFQAVPDRVSPMVAKAVVVVLLSTLLGEAVAFGSWGLSRLLAEDTSQLALNSADAWRHVAGVGLVYGAGALLALGVGALVRQTAGAVSIILVFALVVESVVGFIPNIGDDIQEWMPFTVASKFILGGSEGSGPDPSELGATVVGELSPWGSFAYFAGIALVVYVLSLVVVKRRDA